MFFSRQKHEKPPSPPWLKWVIIGFVLLAIIGNLHKRSAVHQAVSTAARALNPHKIINFSEYRNLLFPQSTASRIKDISEGTGTPAVCGQEVTVSYESLGKDGKPVKNPPLTFHIGDGKAMADLEQDVEGMRTGGRRSIVAPTGKDTAERLEVTLQKLSPPLPDGPFRIATLAPGTPPAVACGAPVAVNCTLWGIDGKKLYSTKEPIAFTPGKSEVFLGLEQGVVGMGKGGKRLLIVPPQFQRTMNGNKPAVDFPFPANQTVLVEVATVP
ncbi:MAG: FKBP-type peptidyl-prolyl cis-trans isomerase [Pseudomonadota bacterium]|nr:FKBP-type peptidyl-prolyl cis-trans isomerase [Pseudomonadota bacterium]MDE3037688.1 FKBP-type peptidyl-prolyl cis-trans isomerase [Pseudomonadota bacterium]